MATVDIVVPAFNCSLWIDQLVESIVSQDFCDWRLIARDDASSDSTCQHLGKWKAVIGDRLVLLPLYYNVNLGMIENYSLLLSCTTSPYVMLADPDDVWLPFKISASLEAMLSLEHVSLAGEPIAICTDGMVVSEDLQIIALSLHSWLKSTPSSLSSFVSTLIDCSALSSTMIVNRALLDLALPLTGASCPDWWLALCATAFGRVGYLDKRTILYRRHSSNDSMMPFLSSLPSFLTGFAGASKRITFLMLQSARQAQEFQRRYSSSLSSNDQNALQALICIPSSSWLSKRRLMLKYGLWPANLLKRIGYLLFA